VEVLAALDDEPRLRDYAPLAAARGDLLQQLGRLDEARAEFERAAALAGNAREQAHLQSRARACASG